MQDPQKLTTAILAVVGVLVAAWLGWLAIGRYRRSLLKDSEAGDGLWGLDDLREMKDSGQLTELEYQALRQKMIREAKGATGGKKDKQNPPAGPNDNISS